LEDNRILLPITVDQQGKYYRNRTPWAQAGYLEDYADPEFIKQHISSFGNEKNFVHCKMEIPASIRKAASSSDAP
jgi:hypothetical protein